jgi:hypothetical protein
MVVKTTLLPRTALSDRSDQRPPADQPIELYPSSNMFGLEMLHPVLEHLQPVLETLQPVFDSLWIVLVALLTLGGRFCIYLCAYRWPS